ncbi:MAG: NAD(P)-binding domain-containing protein [Melioribacteraceae bacterium]|nr:NAD(P)-binding domain-containing protein [Melioribacteraceae bacterium]MCF8354238.1 NAD(P)-binding domain-containing protein [Melioribacteraceae bacterium]MCF8394731.1 NAD(P)-binding domain-containing protein [Melioribacteraceae bacterium]MCF8417969.1 NAD(P)-binding domain-containing protein [Melioribacteraceae bacterium]
MADENNSKIEKLEDLLNGVTKPQNDGERIELVAIVGAGVMGQGIAQSISSAGIDVVIMEKNDDHIEAAKKSLEQSMEKEISRWAMTKSEMKSILSRIKWTLEFSDFKNADLIIEAVDENFQLKRLLFKKFDEISKPETILISNTSTLSLTKIAEVTERKDKVIGMHFLNPVPKVPLVELIRGLETSDKTVEVIKSFASTLGKTAIEVYEYPGYVTTRAIVPLLNEAMYILLEGVASAKDIDTAMKMGYNFPVGPLEMADSMGLDEVLTWMEQLWNTLGEPRYRPCPILRKLVRERKLGKKTGEGFFKYTPDGKIKE